MRTRFNRSLSSVKSLAPCFAPLRVRHTSAYDFTCRHCGEVLQIEKDLFGLLEALLGDSKEGVSAASVKDTLAELEAFRAAPEGTSEHP